MVSATPMSATEIKLAAELCDREPIQWAGAVQGHGALLILEAGGSLVTHASMNLRDWLDISAEEAVGRCARGFLKGLDVEPPGSQLPLTVQVEGPKGDPLLATITHGDRTFIELTRSEEASLPLGDSVALLHERLSEVLMAQPVSDYHRELARLVQDLTGFDRVKIYRFDADWNGTAIAELARNGMDSFLGMSFPAGDIPAQARRLYSMTPARAIPDVDGPTYALVPAAGPTSSQPVDLAHCGLRAVSPIHLQYLRNMGVAASLSISLMHEGKLWGLVACHHPTAKPVSTGVMHVARVLSTLASNQLRLQQAASAGRKQFDLHARISELRRLGPDGFTSSPGSTLHELAKVFDAPLVYARLQGVEVTTGVPEVDALGDLLGEYAERASREPVFSTASLPSLIREALPARKHACGALVIRIGSTWSDFITFFRPERVHEVTWAGRRELDAQVDDDGVLVPRLSFKAWKQKVELTSRPFTPDLLSAALELRAVLTDLFLYRSQMDLERSLESLRSRNEEIREFVYSVSHDLQSPVVIVDGFLKRALMALESGDVERTTRFLARVQEASHRMRETIGEILELSNVGRAEQPSERCELGGIVAATVDKLPDYFPDEPPFEVKVSGSFGAVMMPRLRVEQILDNLLSNAVKYGLTDDERTIWVEGFHDSNRTRVIVRDRGPGIPDKYKDKAFQLFARLHQGDRPGTGVGLPFVRRVMSTYGGEIILDTTGPGAAFILEFQSLSGPKGAAA